MSFDPTTHFSKIMTSPDKQMEMLSCEAFEVASQTGKCDRELARDALKQVSRLSGCEAPEEHLWFESPFALGDWLTQIKSRSSKSKKLGRALNYQIWPSQIGAAIALGASKIPRRKWTIDPCFRLRQIHWEENGFASLPGSILGGQFDSLDLLAWLRIRNRRKHLKQEGPWNQNVQDAHLELARATGWFAVYERKALFSERPVLVKSNEQRLLENFHGPALVYPDGRSIYAIHGVAVSPKTIHTWQELTPKNIVRIKPWKAHVAVLRAFGVERFLAEAGIESYATDKFGRLFDLRPLRLKYKLFQKFSAQGEPDSKSASAWVPVPPKVSRPREAFFWCFSIPPDSLKSQQKPRRATKDQDALPW
jgi:hypothetical protein